jgi:hypothetical protein
MHHIIMVRPKEHSPERIEEEEKILEGNQTIFDQIFPLVTDEDFGRLLYCLTVARGVGLKDLDRRTLLDLSGVKDSRKVADGLNYMRDCALIHKGGMYTLSIPNYSVSSLGGSLTRFYERLANGALELQHGKKYDGLPAEEIPEIFKVATNFKAIRDRVNSYASQK